MPGEPNSAVMAGSGSCGPKDAGPRFGCRPGSNVHRDARKSENANVIGGCSHSAFGNANARPPSPRRAPRGASTWGERGGGLRDLCEGRHTRLQAAGPLPSPRKAPRKAPGGRTGDRGAHKTVADRVQGGVGTQHSKQRRTNTIQHKGRCRERLGTTSPRPPRVWALAPDRPRVWAKP